MTGRTVFLLYLLQRISRQVVPKVREGISELVPIDSTGPIAVEMSENSLPIGYVFPKTCELYIAEFSMGA